MDNKQIRLLTLKWNLEQFKRDPKEILRRVVTVDETWSHGFAGKKFSSNKEVIAETEAHFGEFNKPYFLEGLRKWPERWEKFNFLTEDSKEKKIKKN